MNQKMIIIILGILLFCGAIFIIRQVPEKGMTPLSFATGQPTPRSTGGATPSVTDNRYMPYSPAAFDAARENKRVLYFHADWCSVCRPLDREFSQNAHQIPQDIVLFRTDYDTEKELKATYAITYQHTFVLVDRQGNEVTKWNGGGIAELQAHVSR